MRNMLHSCDITISDLPDSLQDVAQTIGLAAALRLVDAYGGLTRLYIPQAIPTDHHLVRTIGANAAQALCKVYGGDELRNIPRCTAAIRKVRDAEIRVRRSKGVAAARLALEYGLTERQIWTILADIPSNSQQTMLF